MEMRKLAKEKKPEQPIVGFESPEAWETWLEANHGSSPGVWLKIAKKGSATASVTYDQALETALCYGWIDGQKKGFDDAAWLQKFTPRGTRRHPRRHRAFRASAWGA
jgi:uncharacterized protein YdeI (YjbR/CyaY-like superfamily)